MTADAAPARETSRGLVAPALATLVALIVLLALGAWQLQRKTWKEDLIARLEARAVAAPVAPPAEGTWPSWSPADGEFTRVTATGRYLGGRDTLVHGLLSGRRGQPTQGYYVLTPLVSAEGGTILVNRGFVPTEFAAALGPPPGGEANVTGLLRANEIRAAFVPENEPAREEWYVRDIAEIAAAKGLTRVAPFMLEVEATATEGARPPEAAWPLPVGTRRDLPNNHLQYALTWFSLAFVLIVVFAVFARRSRQASAKRRAS